MSILKLSNNEIHQLDIIQELNGNIAKIQAKLKRRAVQIADLKHRLKEAEKYNIGHLSMAELKKRCSKFANA